MYVFWNLQLSVVHWYLADMRYCPPARDFCIFFITFPYCILTFNTNSWRVPHLFKALQSPPVMQKPQLKIAFEAAVEERGILYLLALLSWSVIENMCGASLCFLGVLVLGVIDLLLPGATSDYPAEELSISLPVSRSVISCSFCNLLSIVAAAAAAGVTGATGAESSLAPCCAVSWWHVVSQSTVYVEIWEVIRRIVHRVASSTTSYHTHEPVGWYLALSSLSSLSNYFK